MAMEAGGSGLAAGVLFTALLYLFLWHLLFALRRDARLATAGGRAVLTVLESSPEAAAAGLEPHRMIALTGTATLGRGSDNTVVLPDDLVSHAHARLLYRNGAWWVEDLGSMNGTFVNGRPASGLTRVVDGDVVACGPRVRLRLHEA